MAALRSLDETCGDIGRRVSEVRNQRGLTQHELAEKVGISFKRLQDLEEGVSRPSITTLHRIATALGVDVRVLLEEPKSREVVMGRPPKTP